jgi:Tfp pilus assembly protein PilP
MTRLRLATLTGVLIAVSHLSVHAQQPAQGLTPVPQPVAPQAAAPTPPPNYAYDVGGRRDPFLSLLNRGTDARGAASAGSRPDGLAGISVEELSVRGIVQSRGGWVAMIAAPSGRTYTIRPGDRLMDGNVRTITGQAVVLMQEVNDPLSLQKQREVRKFLRAEVK